MATKTAPQRTLADFPEVVQTQQRLTDLYARQSEAKAELQRVEAGAPKPTHVRDQDHVDALLSGKDPEAIDLAAVKEHGRRMAEQEKLVALIGRAIEQQIMKAGAARGEASGAILRERQAEFFAKSRAVIAALLQVYKAYQEEQAFRFELGQQDIAGAETVWQLPVWGVIQLGSLDEPDSAIVRILREALGMGIVSPEEFAKIRAGGEFPVA